MPLLEAQDVNTAIVCSDIEVNRETAGDGALFFNPRSEKDLVKKLKLILTNSQIHDAIIKKGKKNLLRFDWDKTAKITLNALLQ